MITTTTTYRVFFFLRNLKTGLSYNIGIGLILKIVNWTIFNLNFIDLER